MDLNTLLSLSPLDGRYVQAGQSLRECASEFGLIRYRVQVEIAWFLFLNQHPGLPENKELSPAAKQTLTDLLERFSLEDAEQIKSIENTTNHDVKAVEYFLSQAFEASAELKPLKNFIHFACTSEDINNLAYGLMLKQLRSKTVHTLKTTMEHIDALSKTTQAMPLLSLTHGQPASPTTLGKELRNVSARLERQLLLLVQQPILGKMNGAVGNFNAHHAAYPEIDWITASKQFVESLELVWNPWTTQIEPHDGMAEMFDTMARINTILIDFSADVWGYISRGVFTQKLKDGEVGSSTMPHKINPIDFENAEGNFGMANAVFGFLARKLPRSRFQRDLTDSTVLRNLGVAFGYSHLAMASMQKGLAKLSPNPTVMTSQLEEAWETLGEAIQTVMRRYGQENPYEQLKALTRGKSLHAADLQSFIDGLKIPQEAKDRLKVLTPKEYVGLAQKLTALHLP